MEFILSPRLLQPAALAGWRALLSHQYLSWVSDSGSSKNESSAPPKNGDQYSNLWFDTSLPKGRQNRDKQHESINVRKRQQPGQKICGLRGGGPRKLRLDIFITFQWKFDEKLNWTFTIYFLPPFLNDDWHKTEVWINWVCFDFAIELPDIETYCK